MIELWKSWERAWRGIGAAGDGKAVFALLVARYAEPHRHYHTTQHLSECLAAFDAVIGLAQQPAEVETGLWFHDAIYDLQRHDNEQQSAVWAQRALREAGVSGEAAERVHALIMATRHTALPAPGDAQLLVDIDLGILGADDRRFAEYEQQIRDEYAFVPESLFKQKRRAILQGFLDRPRIFSTAHFHGLLEGKARDNLMRAVA